MMSRDQFLLDTVYICTVYVQFKVATLNRLCAKVKQKPANFVLDIDY